MRTWGDNEFGQLGAGYTGGYSTMPVAVPDISQAVEVSAGNAHVLVVVQDGVVKAWGYNNSGQLGIGVTGGIYNRPEIVHGYFRARAIAAGWSHSLDIAIDGKV